jgi:hypothetical protein
MADLKNTLKDYGLQVLNSLLSGGSKPEAGVKEPKLEDINEADLRQEIIRLEIEERKISEKMTAAEKRKQDLFEEAVRNPGKGVAEMNWSRTKELESEIANYQSLNDVISKRRRIINGLIQLKVRARMLQSPVFENTPLTALIPYIEKMAENGEMGEAEMDEVIHTLEFNTLPQKKGAEDPDKAAWLRAIEEARMKGISSDEESGQTDTLENREQN